jgi:hypothetical protein
MEENKNKEEIISQILNKNEYPQQMKKKIIQKTSATEPHIPQKRKWVTFTYFGPYVRTINKLFRNTKLKVAFKPTNTIKHHIK